MKKVVVISVYLGNFPKHYGLFLRSVEKNPTIDFKIFTDQLMKSCSPNLEYIYLSLEQLNKLIKEKLGKEFKIVEPYKCCDFRPAYGVLFDNYIEDYDFWGHCDLDMIFGDIREFITDDILNKYDKILPLGHLSLYRNTKQVNNRYTDVGSINGDYKTVFSSNKNYAFDELSGIGQIYYKNSYPFYDKRIFVDISILRKRFTLAMGDKNYKNQVFYWENGHVFRAYEDGGKIKKDEFVYIHFKQRKYLEDKTNTNDCDSFYICDQGFINKKIGLPTKNEIKKYNKYHGFFYEYLESKISKLKILASRVKRRLLND